MSAADSEGLFVVVVNDEDQYSIWGSGRDVPAGWRAVTPPEKKSHCLEYIEQHWTDMRPKSQRT